MNKYVIPSFFTPEQKSAVTLDNTNILVSAAAGCGKTTLMVERIIRKIINDRVNINELIVVTFTEAAAAELKQRLEIELSNRLSENDSFIKKQLSLLNDSYIMTFHALCFRLLKENQASFKFNNPLVIGDNLQINTQKKLAYQQLLNEHGDSESFIILDDYYNDLINKDGLFNIIDKTLSTCIAKGGINRFSNQDELSYNSIFDLDDFNCLQIEATNFYLRNIINALSKMLAFDLSEKNQQTIINDLDFFKSIINDLSSYDYETIHNKLFNYKLFRKPAKMGEEFSFFHSEIKENNLKPLQDLYALSNKEMLEYINQNNTNVKHLIHLVKIYHKNLILIKKDSGILEFDDLEQLLIDLLYDNNHFSDAAIRLQECFNEIMIDEYQDTNYIQETIVSALSNGSNVFMVGDLKQSIYRFRNATSKIFSDKYSLYKNTDKGEVIDLSFNFRSKNEVLETTNYIFKSTFSNDIGGINYDKNAQLYFKNEKLNDIKGSFETDYLINTNTEKQTSKQLYALNAKMISDEINNLIKEGKTYNQIAILVKNRTNITILTQELEQQDIPYMLHTNAGFYHSYEIKDLINLLQVLVNPYNDITLLASLHSYFFNLDDNDLYNLSQLEGKTYFEKLSKSNYIAEYNLLLDLINISKKNNILDIINYIFNNTNYLAYIQTHNNYEQILININSFKQILESNYSYYLSLEYLIDELKDGIDRNFDSALPAVLSSKQNVVNIMTIHKSKGLEFDYVFLCDNSKINFEVKDTSIKTYNNQLILPYYNYEKQIKGINPLDGKTYHPLMNLINYKNKKEVISEELRVLYVALTRAKLKLYIIDSISEEQLDQAAFKASLSTEWLLDSSLIFNYKKMLEPILYSFIRHKSGLALRGSTQINVSEDIFNYSQPLFNIKKYFIEAEKQPTTKQSIKSYPIKSIEKKDIKIEPLAKQSPSTHKINKLDFSELKDFDTFAQGTNTHLVLELLDFSSHTIKEDALSLIESYNVNNLNKQGILYFISSDFFNEIKNYKIYKEYSITYIENNILYKGIIDLYVESDDCIYVIDYKSDNLSKEELINLYQEQLYSYEKMINTNKKIELYIYSIKNCEFIRLLPRQ